jgi:hypothetical protein
VSRTAAAMVFLSGGIDRETDNSFCRPHFCVLSESRFRSDSKILVAAS